MKALVFDHATGLQLHEVGEPVPGADEVMVEVGRVGVCGSDLGVFRGGMPGLRTPVVPGHEFGGRVADGDPVVVNPMIGCGACPRCAAGNTHLCAQRRILGITRDGAYAERVAVPRRNLVLAGGLAAKQAALVEPIANGVHAWRRAGCPTGRVAIIGAGAIGMCLLHVLRARGLQDITVIDPVPARLEWARLDGASATGARLSGAFEAVFDAAGTQGTRVDAVACTAPGGTTALLGLHDDVLQLSAASLITADRSLAGCFGYSESAFKEAVTLAADIDTRWTEEVHIDEAQAVLAALIAGRGAPGTIKTLIRFD